MITHTHIHTYYTFRHSAPSAARALSLVHALSQALQLCLCPLGCLCLRSLPSPFHSAIGAIFLALALRPRMLACTFAAASADSCAALFSAPMAVSGGTTMRFDPATNSSQVKSPEPSASRRAKAWQKKRNSNAPLSAPTVTLVSHEATGKAEGASTFFSAFLFFILPKNFLASFLFFGLVSAALHSSAETVPSPSASERRKKRRA